MSFLVYIVFGGIVGWVASLIMKTDSQQGILLNIIVGVIGAVLGSWLVGFFGIAGVSNFDIPSFLVALLGSVILIAAVRTIR